MDCSEIEFGMDVSCCVGAGNSAWVLLEEQRGPPICGASLQPLLSLLALWSEASGRLQSLPQGLCGLPCLPSFLSLYRAFSKQNRHSLCSFQESPRRSCEHSKPACCKLLLRSFVRSHSDHSCLSFLPRGMYLLGLFNFSAVVSQHSIRSQSSCCPG